MKNKSRLTLRALCEGAVFVAMAQVLGYIKLFSLLTGLLLTGIGLVLTLLFWVVQGFSYPLLGGLLPLIIGVSFLVFFKFCPANSKHDGEA